MPPNVYSAINARYWRVTEVRAVLAAFRCRLSRVPSRSSLETGLSSYLSRRRDRLAALRKMRTVAHFTPGHRKCTPSPQDRPRGNE
jgi:hypothetical protein